MKEQKLIANRYEVKESIGQGGMGTVYRGIDTITAQQVAIKVLKPDIVAEDPSLLERFQREGEALRLLNHPNIVKMFGAFSEENDHYLVMEYVGGGSLQDLMNNQPKMPVARVLEIALDLADALTRAHRLKIIHRDIKPANVLLAEDGTPKLTDFGVAQLGNRTRMTQGGTLVGTYAYLSPEVCMGEDLDARTDIWSFGVVLYEMLAGQRPFENLQPGALLTAIITKPVPPLTDFRPDAPEQLIELIHSMLEKERAKRISSVRLVGADLESIIENSDVLSTDVREQLTGDRDTSAFATPTPSSIPPRSGTPLPSKSRTGALSTSEISMSSEQRNPTIAPTPQIVVEKPKRSPLPFIIAGVVALVLLIAAVVFVLPNLNPAPTQAAVAQVEPAEDGRYMVLVGQLENLGGNEQEITRLVINNLRQTLEVDAPSSRLSMREYPQVIASQEAALAAAEANNAAVVIWGNYSSDFIELNVVVGSTAPFPRLTMPRETIEQVVNIRFQLTDARTQSVAPQILVVMAALFSADGNTYEVARDIAVIEQLNSSGVTIEGNSIAARYHRAVNSFFSDTQVSLNELSEAINLNATNPLLYALRTLVQLRLSNMTAVVTDAQTAERLGPENWALPSFSLLTNELFFEQDYPAAIEYANEIATLRPDDWFALTFRAATYYAAGEYELARADVDQAIALGPQANFTYSLAASIAMRQDNVEDAQRLAGLALTEFPDPTSGNRIVSAVFGESLPVIELSVAFANMSLGQFDAALQNVDAALSRGTPTSDLYLVQGLAYCNLQEYDLAAEAYSTGIEIDPDFWLLYLLRAESLQKGGNLIAALQDIATVQNGEAGEAYADIIARGVQGEEGLDCSSFFGGGS